MKKLRKYLEIITLFFVTIFVLTLPEEGIIYGQPLTPPRPVSVYFEYSMQDRFGMDSNGDGLIDHNYSRNYVRPPLGYTVIFDGCPSSSGGRGPIVSYTWNVIGPGNSTSIADSSCKQTINLREGVHTVTLTITLQDGKTYSKTQRIAIEDILIVSIGDSYSSGEGNPDREQQFDSLGFVERGPVWQDRQCHRSANAYPAQASNRNRKVRSSHLSHLCILFLFGC